MLDNMFVVINSPITKPFATKPARHYLQHDLRSFYAIVRPGHILYPGVIDGDFRDTTFANGWEDCSRGRSRVDLLIVRAISSVIIRERWMILLSYVGTCCNSKENKAGWGEKALSNSSEIYSATGSEDEGGGERRYSGSEKRQSTVEMVMKDKMTVPYA